MTDNVFKAKIKFFNEQIEELPVLNNLGNSIDQVIHLYGFIIKDGVYKEKSSLWKTLEILDKNYDIKRVSGRNIFSNEHNIIDKLFPVADNFNPDTQFDFASTLYINAGMKINKDILSWEDGLPSANKVLKHQNNNKYCFLHVREFLKNPRIIEQYYPHLKYKE